MSQAHIKVLGLVHGNNSRSFSSLATLISSMNIIRIHLVGSGYDVQGHPIDLTLQFFFLLSAKIHSMVSDKLRITNEAILLTLIIEDFQNLFVLIFYLFFEVGNLGMFLIQM